jgi:hypothetical protein
MASATFTVEHPRNRRYAIQQDIAEIAGRLAADASANTPRRTGAMAAGWHTVPGQDPGTTLVVNSAPHARYVEYGTRHMPAKAPLGRATAAGRR